MALDLQKYLGLFASEAGEHLAAFGRELVRLERAPPSAARNEIVDALFRHAHSVKGMSASMQLDGIASLAHRLEDLVALFRAAPARLDAAAVDLLLAAGDALQGMVQEAAKGGSPAEEPVLSARLAEAAARYRGAPGPPPAATAPVEPP
ncbi:Hpt domain-containing protein, partial [Anaeromyxobacter sp. SG64]